MEFERELRQQLSRQAAAHSDHLQDVLQVEEQELQDQCEREVHMQLLQERQSFQTEVAGWIARLKGIETAVEGEGSLLCCSFAFSCTFLGSQLFVLCCMQ